MGIFSNYMYTVIRIVVADVDAIDANKIIKPRHEISNDVAF